MEESWNLAPILIPLAALLAGWAIGFFDSNLRTSKKIKQAEESAKAAIEAAENKVAEAQAKLMETSATRDNPDLLRIKNENGRLTLDLDGARVDTSNLTANQRKRLIEMLNAMRPWLEGKPAPAPITTPPPPPAPVPAPPPIASPPPQPAARPSTAKSEPLPKKKDDKPEAAPTSIVEQINVILQARIADTPLASRGVILMESVTGGVNIYIGVDKYEGLDSVPDEEVKKAIRAAIDEWERKYTPGL
ncbi:MAG: hypothetical protein L6Q26_08230 [Anaerolineales bacterium]|nr:hypothetical protein [Anaerolineales bacterium]NUQ84237.1 hypothetical protein [Anaerolineales bacterium]